MSPPHVYHNHPGIFHSESLPDPDVTNVTTQWYTPTSYAFDTSYMTPLPSSEADHSQAWTQLARSSTGQEDLLPQYTSHPRLISIPTQPYATQYRDDQSRPKSSPSVFRPSTESITWPLPSAGLSSAGLPSDGLGIFSSGSIGQPTPVTSTFPPSIFQAYPSEEHYVKDEPIHHHQQQQQQQQQQQDQPRVVASPPELQQPQPRRPYPSIAPDPHGAAAQKRKLDADDDQDLGPSSRKRKRTSSVASADLSEDDRLLVNLKEEQNLPWKDIADRYSLEKGKRFQVAALQMRYKRLREKHRVWTEHDLSALKSAYDVWEKRKWEIISEKMLEFGLEERWNPKQCARKWQELEMTAVNMVTTAGLTPALSQFSTSQLSSPIEAPSHYAWMPFQ